MRIEFNRPFIGQAHYVFCGIRENIRGGKSSEWSFEDKTYWLGHANPIVITLRGGMTVASRTLFRSPIVWTVVTSCGRKWQIIETLRKGGCVRLVTDWKSTDGKHIMTFFRTGCWTGTAVIRPDWSKDVGVLVGMIMTAW